MTAPAKPGDFSTVQPIEKNVQLVRELKQAQHRAAHMPHILSAPRRPCRLVSLRHVPLVPPHF